MYAHVFGDGWAEWRGVKQALFSPAATPEARRAALACVAVWRARAREHRPLPAYVEATALLVETVLADEEDRLPAGAQAQAYGAAIARCVHLLAGYRSATSGQTYRRCARETGLPEEAVEVRQRVAHGELPTLPELRFVAGAVLQFLFQAHWVPQEARAAAEETEAEAQAQEVLEGTTRRARQAAPLAVSRRRKETAAAPAPARLSKDQLRDLLDRLSSSSGED